MAKLREIVEFNEDYHSSKHYNPDDDSSEVKKTLRKLSSLAIKYKKAVNKKIPNSYKTVWNWGE